METEKVENVEGALKSIDLNSEEGQKSTEHCCGYCGKKNPTKRCSKRHTRCMTKMFCDKTCETSGHKKVTTLPDPDTVSENKEEGLDDQVAKDMAAAAKIEKAKKKKAKKQSKGQKPDGEFWWNNSVYASW